jgi:hypothetical protein
VLVNKLALACLLVAAGHGQKMVFQTAQNLVTHTGCLLSKDGRFIQQDEDTQQVFEINGPASDLKANIGNRVQITGRLSTNRPVVQIAGAVIDVATVSPRSRGGCLSVASGLEAQAN